MADNKAPMEIPLDQKDEKESSQELVKNISDNTQNIEDILFIVGEKFSKDLKKQVETVQKNRKAEKDQLEKLKQNTNPKNKEQSKAALLFENVKAKIIEKFPYMKKIFGFLGNIIKGLKGLKDRLKDMANSNMFANILKMLLLLSIIDPNGTFMKSIFNIITDLVVMVIGIMTSMLPRVVKTFVFLITTILPPALRKAIDAIFGAIGNMFSEWAKKADNPVIKWILNTLSYLFGSSGPIATVLKLLTPLAPVLIVILMVLKFLPIILTVMKAIMAVFSFITMWPVLLVIAVATIGILIYKYRKQIMEGLKSAADAVAKWIGRVVMAIGRFVKTVISNVVGGIGWFANLILAPFKYILGLLQPVLQYLMKIFPGVTKIITGLWDIVSNVVLKALKGVKEGFMSIGDWFSGLATTGLDWITKGEEGRSSYMEMKKSAREKGIDLGKVEKALKADSTQGLNKAEIQAMSILKKTEGGSFEKKAETIMENKSGGTVFKNIKSVATDDSMKAGRE